MRDNMYENKWSPFDPKWYSQAFDKFISTADELFNTDLIIEQGYHIPDSDGSRSSIFRNEAVLNNSFNENKLRETLKDIYINSSHKLVANNHDNVHFFQWNGYMKDMNYIPNTNLCEIKVPTDSFIYPNQRDSFKLSQLYRRWIKIEDILNNWDIFRWNCLLFIDQRIYSEYELRIDDYETTIRFKYVEFWVQENYPVYIYRIDTNAQCRILISKELCKNQWKWKLPLSYINDKRIINSKNIVVNINKIGDENIRKDGLTHVDVLGDNLEFLTIDDGYIDLNNISKYNKIYIESEATEYLWMSIFVPKFMHEYPILLPTDVIFRPYEANLYPVVTIDHELIQHVKTNVDDKIMNKQVYVDLNGKLKEEYDGWKQLIRPIVLSDSYDGEHVEPYEGLTAEVDNLRDLTVKGADIIEDFRFFLKGFNLSIEDFDNHIEKIINIIYSIREAHNAFLDKMLIEYNKLYERRYKKFINIINTIKEDKFNSEWLKEKSPEEENEDNDFWFMISPLIYIPRELADKYYIINVIESLGDKKNLYKESKDYNGQVRFQRPIEENDFWTFEYDKDKEVWRPFPLQVTRHFPDVYLLKDINEDIPSLNRLFKSFFFYSDTINILNESSDITRATPSWDDDMDKYHYNQGGVYRDIFMEKFYWMGVRSIYKGLLVTNNRWEALEYIIDNPSYDRFNQLFITTMDPYFKLGLATYLKSSNYQFPFDDAINKMEESINTNWLGYKRVTNFEIYLNKTWIPSYFDYVTKILDDWEYDNGYEDKLITRPKSTFDIDRLLPLLLDIQNDIHRLIDNLLETLEWLIKELSKEDYNLDINLIIDLKNYVIEIYDNVDNIIKCINELDKEIYSIDDINHIIDLLNRHIDLTSCLDIKFSNIYEDAELNNIYDAKREILSYINNVVESLPTEISKIVALVHDFDMDSFMKVINDLRSYFDYAKTNPDDNSLIGHINKFDDAWSVDVKEKRNKLFQSTSILYGNYEPSKVYENEEVTDFINMINNVKDDIQNFRESVIEFWRNFQYKQDQYIIDKLDYLQEFIDNLAVEITEYVDRREELLSKYREILRLFDLFNQYTLSDVEYEYKGLIYEELLNMIRSVSHLSGKDSENDAIVAIDTIKFYLIKWNIFIDHERDVFVKIFNISQPPVQFLDKINRHNPMIKVIVDYMDTVNIKYIPNNNFPTYSDVYVVDDIEIITGGFGHNNDEMVFIPSLGVYKISSVNEETTTVENIDIINESLSFINPMNKYRSYDSITNGTGVGITVKPVKVSNIKIINDEIVNQIIMKINNLKYLINRDIEGANPHRNIDLNNDIDIINNINESWNNIMGVYSDYMSEDIKVFMNNIIDTLLKFIDPCNEFILFRSRINVTETLELFKSFIFKSYDYFSSLEGDNKDFYYYDDKLRSNYSILEVFYDNGATWSDSNRLKDIMYDCVYQINSFRTNIILKVTKDDIIELKELSDDLLKMMNEIISTLTDLPTKLIDINFTMNELNNKLVTIPELQKDIWYRIKSIEIAFNGRDYKAGDIVKLQGYDIYLQITSAVDGYIKSFRPLLEYALKDHVHGVIKTETMVGNGTGLIITMSTTEIQLSDSTLFRNEESDIKDPPMFDENDLFMFKFENIYDLDLNYEVFLGGKQITNFSKRHIKQDNHLHPNDIDVIYINANEVMELKNSSIFIPAEHYFIYKLDNVEIVDPGSGYAIGQDIFVDTGQMSLKLQVTKLDNTPFKGINELEVSDNSTRYKYTDPSATNAKVATDSLNNIDDEFNNGYYNKLTHDQYKNGTLSYPIEDYPFKFGRFDNLVTGDKNSTFMFPNVDMPLEDVPKYGDPDFNFYLGNRIDNSQHPLIDERKWNGIINVIPPTDPFLPDNRRFPTGNDPKGEYQLICKCRIHNTAEETNSNVTSKYNGSNTSIRNAACIGGDLQVPYFSYLPKHLNDYPDGGVGKCVIVDYDETHDGHRMLYRIRTFVAAGFFVYDLPEYADLKWDHFNIDWMNCDFHHDLPDEIQHYPSAPWDTSDTYRNIIHEITDGKHADVLEINKINHTSYIHNLTLDDISVFNWTTKEWEDLYDSSRWKLESIYNNNGKYGFKLIFLQEGTYSYDMELYLNKLSTNQMLNESLKRDAIINVSAVIAKEVDKPSVNYSVNTGRNLIIRKTFPFEQRETFTIGKSINGDPLGYEMDFKFKNYIHFKNELHLEDIKIFNKTAGRFEDVLDRSMFEVRFKDSKAVNRGYETQTKIISSIIGNPGEGFVDGKVWGWNNEFQIHIFGEVTSDFTNDGHILTFKPLHCPNPPEEDIQLEFQIFQNNIQSEMQMAIVLIEFHTERVEVYGDGYIHNISNRYAPLPEEFKVIVQYDLDGPFEYEIIVEKTSKRWEFTRPDNEICPVFHLDHYSIPSDNIYLLTNKGRFPLINPSTNKPSIQVNRTDIGTDVTFLNIYRRYEKINICSVPYPMRSVYTQRKIPSHGYINLRGKINKPLNKKYFEFWVNGKLLTDEVTIITPSKIFLHGLTSLKNLEIIEINRDYNEYFSDNFIDVEIKEYGRPYVKWDYDTYLDAALEGRLDEDNYTEEEQEYLLSPVWKQVEKDHPEFKNYPPNTDTDEDILLRTNEDDNINGLENPIYQFLIMDTPTLEGHPIMERTLSFEHFGLKPITDSMIINMLNEEWKEEIESDPYLPEHFIMSDDEWYGMATRLYDEYGILVHNLNESVYHVADNDLLRINVSSKLSRIVKNKITYDLS